MSDQTRIAPTWVSWLLVLIGVLFLAAGIVYLTRSASALPSFFPGHDVTVHRKHTRSGLGAIGLAVIAFVAAWFVSRKRA